MEAQKKKVRTRKTDNHPRNNLCFCGKDFISPSSLTTHRKTKHTEEEISNSGFITNIKSRERRPRINREDREANQKFEFLGLNLMEKFLAYLQELQIIEQNLKIVADDENLTTETDPVQSFPEDLFTNNEYFQPILDEIKYLVENHENDFRNEAYKIHEPYQAFAYFLRQISQFLTVQGYHEIVVFIVGYAFTLKNKQDQLKESHQHCQNNQESNVCKEFDLQMMSSYANDYLYHFRQQFFDSNIKNKNKILLLGSDENVSHMINLKNMIQKFCLWLFYSNYISETPNIDLQIENLTDGYYQ